LGVTPSAWSGSYKVNQVLNAGFIGNGNRAYVSANWYDNGTADKYIASDYATRYIQLNGTHRWDNAASGTAGNTITFTQAMTLDASGRLVVGTTAVSGSNQVEIQAVGTNTGLWVQTGQTSSSYYIADFRTGTNASVLSLRADNTALVSGNLLVGTTSGINSGKVAVSFAGATQNAIETQDIGTNSGAGFFSCRNSGGTQIGSITRVGTTNAVIFNTTSDQRLKSNIENASPVLDKLLQVQVRQFDWTDGDLHQDYGFIAQELEPLLSGVVTKGKTEEDVWQLDYSRLTPHLVKAIQEQQALITDMAAKLKSAGVAGF